MRKLCVCCAVFMLLGVTWRTAGAVEIFPVGYGFDRATDVGSFAYHDESGHQLTDGQYGVAPWSANLGNGPAYEWVGWVNDSPVNIDFDFGGTVNIGGIHVGSVQDHVNDVVLPWVKIYSSDNLVTFNLLGEIYLPESNLNDNLYHTYLFDALNINARYVRVALLHSYNGPWTFVDEVDFYGGQPVPVPAALWLLGSGLAGLAVLRRKLAH